MKFFKKIWNRFTQKENITIKSNDLKILEMKHILMLAKGYKRTSDIKSTIFGTYKVEYKKECLSKLKKY